MKIPLLVTLFFSLLLIPGKTFNSHVNTNCTDWEAFLLADGTNSKLSILFCNISESGGEFFEIKNDTELDAKLICQINFKNGKYISNEVIVQRDDKARFHFGDETNVNQSGGVSSWKFDKIQFKPHGGFNANSRN